MQPTYSGTAALSSTPNITYRFTATASRFNGLEDLIEETAHLLGLGLEMRVKKGWLWFTIFGAITGPATAVNKFCHQIDASIKDHLERSKQ